MAGAVWKSQIIIWTFLIIFGFILSPAKSVQLMGTSTKNMGNLLAHNISHGRSSTKFHVEMTTGAIITTVAGTCGAAGGSTGDGASALSATLNAPYGIGVDTAGNIYIADSGNNKVRKVTASTGFISTYAGSTAGFSGDGGLATSAKIYTPYALALDSYNNLFIGDNTNWRVRNVSSTTNKMQTFIGNRYPFIGGDGGPASNAYYNSPTQITGDSKGNLYVLDKSNLRIRKIAESTTTVSTILGTGTSITLTTPVDMCVALIGKHDILYYIDASKIRKFNLTSLAVLSIAGNSAGYGGDGSAMSTAVNTFSGPQGITADSLGNLYIADSGNHRVRKITASTGIVSTIAGTGTAGFSGDNAAATSAQINKPYDVAVDASFNVYFIDLTNLRIRKITASTGIITTIAGTGTAATLATNGDGGPATSARIGAGSYSIVLDSAGNVYFSDSTVNRIRQIEVSTGTMRTIVGTGAFGCTGDGARAINARINDPFGVYVTSNGILYFVDRGTMNIHKVNSTVAGLGTMFLFSGRDSCYTGDGEQSSRGAIVNPYAMTIDGSGNKYLADRSSQVIRMVNPAGIISTLAGTAFVTGFSGDNGPATSATLYNPSGLCIDGSGNLLIADYSNFRIRKVDLNTKVITTLAGNGLCTTLSDSSVEIPMTGGICAPNSIAADGVMYVYFSDNKFVVRQITMTTGMVKIIAGTFGTTGSTGNNVLATSALVSTVRSMIVEAGGTLLISDTTSNCIRRISSVPTMLPTTQPTCQPSSQPTSYPSKPSSQPSSQPTAMPSDMPSSQPTMQPTMIPSRQPSSLPTGQPSSQPTNLPTSQPSTRPSSQPSMQPSCLPTSQPSLQPSSEPSSQPSIRPSSQPSVQPSRLPSSQPSGHPSSQPSCQPSVRPSNQPSYHPTAQPSDCPSSHPSHSPSAQPSRQPSSQPSGFPSALPSGQPTRSPSTQPSRQPTSQPSSQPSCQPLAQPSSHPSGQPSSHPSGRPSRQPSCQPTSRPSKCPSAVPSSQPSSQPTSNPSRQPVSRPSTQPSSNPSIQPSRQPSSQPSVKPSTVPSGRPSRQPSSVPTTQPSSHPSRLPSRIPSAQPSISPSAIPSKMPSTQPSSVPSRQPSGQPSHQPNAFPTSNPSAQPSSRPSMQPASHPTSQPSSQPSSLPSRQPISLPTSHPSSQPSNHPTRRPTCMPSSLPSTQPTRVPTRQPTVQPTRQPTGQPNAHPTSIPSTLPSISPNTRPTSQPSMVPSSQPTSLPSFSPSSQPTSQPSVPTSQPTSAPSRQPIARPSSQPTKQPISHPTMQPSSQPSRQPTGQPNSHPSSQPSMQPTRQPTGQPLSAPTSVPSRQPTQQPTKQPWSRPTSQPSQQPSQQPSVQPSSQPSRSPTSQPSRSPSDQPTSSPTSQPSRQPSRAPSRQPTTLPTCQPTCQPSARPTKGPSSRPSMCPSIQPSSSPSCQPSMIPTSQPSAQPVSRPTRQPSCQPSASPTKQPTVVPSSRPSRQPSSHPSRQPSIQPTCSPTTQPSGRPTAQPTSVPSLGFEQWNVAIEILDDVDIPNDALLESYCVEDSWLKTQTRSGRCSLRAAVRFCLYRAPWYLGTLHSCRVYFPPSSLFVMDPSMSNGIEMPFSTSLIDESKYFEGKSGPVLPYAVNLIIDGQGSSIESDGKYRMVSTVFEIGNGTTWELMNPMQHSMHSQESYIAHKPWFRSSLSLWNLDIHSDFNSSLHGEEGGPLSISSIGRFSMINVSVHGCRSLRGGALWVSDVSYLSIESSEFKGNAAFNGGSVSLTRVTDASVVSSAFADNVADNIGGALSLDGAVNVTMSDCIFAGNEASTFGGAISLHDVDSFASLSHNVFVSNRAIYGSAVVLGSTFGGIFLENEFRDNRATEASTVHWISRTMPEPSRVSNVFINNVAGVYGPEFATNTHRLMPSDQEYLVNDYNSGHYPIAQRVTVVDYYNHVIPNEDKVVITAFTDVRKGHCVMNQPKTFGVTTSLTDDGVSYFTKLGATCIPGGNANLTYSASLLSRAAMYPDYTKIRFLQAYYKRSIVSGDVYVTFRRCGRGEIYDLKSVTKNTCTVCRDGYSFNDNSKEYVTECTPCPSRARECYGDQIVLPTGKWRFGVNNSEIYSCPLQHSCRGGNSTGDGLCYEGYHGPMCGVCDDGYYKTSDNYCLPCNQDGFMAPTQMIYMTCTFILVMSIIAFLIHRLLLANSKEWEKLESFVSGTNNEAFEELETDNQGHHHHKHHNHHNHHSHHNHIHHVDESRKGPLEIDGCKNDSPITHSDKTFDHATELTSIIVPLSSKALDLHNEMDPSVVRSTSLSIEVDDEAKCKDAISKSDSKSSTRSKSIERSSSGFSGSSGSSVISRSEGDMNGSAVVVAQGPGMLTNHVAQKSSHPNNSKPEPTTSLSTRHHHHHHHHHNHQRRRKLTKKTNWSARAKIIISTLQIVACSFTVKVALPSFFVVAISFLSILKFDFSQVVPMNCFSRYSFMNQLQVATVFPIFVVVAFILLLALLLVYGNRRSCDAKDKVSFMQMYQQRIMSILMVFSYYSLPTVSLKIFQTFGCIPIEEDSTQLYLAQDLSINCASSYYFWGMSWAVVSVGLFPIGVPAFYYFLIRSFRLFIENRDLLQNTVHKANFVGREGKRKLPILVTSSIKHYIKSFGFLFMPYKSEYWYWEVVEVYRRLTYTAILPSIFLGSVTQITLSIFVSICFMKLYDITHPFETKSENAINDASNFQLVFVYLAVSIAMQNSFSSFPRGDDVLNTMLIISNSFIAVVTIYYALKEAPHEVIKTGIKVLPAELTQHHEYKRNVNLKDDVDLFRVRMLVRQASSEVLTVLQAIVFSDVTSKGRQPSENYQFYYNARQDEVKEGTTEAEYLKSLNDNQRAMYFNVVSEPRKKWKAKKATITQDAVSVVNQDEARVSAEKSSLVVPMYLEIKYFHANKFRYLFRGPNGPRLYQMLSEHLINEWGRVMYLSDESSTLWDSAMLTLSSSSLSLSTDMSDAIVSTSYK